MRVYNRPMNGGSWTSVEDYLDTDSALGYGYNWRYRHTGGELLMMGATGEPSGYYPSDAVGFHTQSVPTSCECLVVPQALAVCAPLENCGATCGIAPLGGAGNPDMPYLNLNGVGGLPQYGLRSDEHHHPHFLILPIIVAALRGCLAGVAMDALFDIARWLGCAIAAIVLGKPVIGSCGSFPVPGLCDLVASCLTGALTGGILQKLFPNIKDVIRDLIAGLAGSFGGGVCDAIRAPTPCPPPSSTPKPPKPAPPAAPPAGGGGGMRLGPLPAV